jgi:putative PEP-CTERM system TPR-repeat lipoprotein
MRHKQRVVAAVVFVVFTMGCGYFPQSDNARFLKRGDALLANGDFSRAVLEFRNAVQRTPDSAEAQYRLGVAYLGAGDVPDGILALRHAVELNPNHVGAQIKLAELMAVGTDAGVLRDAIARLQSVLTVQPDNLEATDILALAEWRLGNVDDAAKRLEDALLKFPSSLHSAVELARLKMSRRDLAGAEAVLKKVVGSAPQSADAAVALGELYLLLDRTGDAERYFVKATELDTQNGAALMGLAAVQIASRRLYEAERTLRRAAALPGSGYKPQHAIFLYRTGNPEAALAEFESLAKSDPADRAARTRLISAYFAMRKFSEAQAILAAVLKKNPQDLDALLQQSELSLRSGKTTEAEADLKQVLHFTPDSAQARLALAEVYRLQRRMMAEREELTEALRLDASLLVARLELARSFLRDEPKNALQVLDEAPEAQQSILAVVLERNWALLALGDTKKVRDELNRNLRMWRIPDLVLQDAALRVKENDYTGARSAAEEVLSKNPEDARAARVIADSYVAQKQYAKAHERLVQIVAARPSSAPLQHLLGQWCMTMGKLPEARRAFENAKAADAKFAGADFGLAEVDIRDGQTGRAIERLRGIAAAEPGNIPALLKLAGLEEEAGDRDQATARYRAVLDVDDWNLLALNNLAGLLAMVNVNEALKFAQKAAERAPDNPAVLDTLGWVYFRKGFYTMALTQLKNAVAKEPTPKREFHLAVSYLRSGDKVTGQKLLQKALEKDPNLPKTEQGW